MSQGTDPQQQPHPDQPGAKPSGQQPTRHRKNGPANSVDPAYVIALALSGIWVLGILVYLLFLPQPGTSSQVGVFMSILAVGLPLALIWIAATVVKTARIMRAENAHLHSTVETLHQTFVALNQTPANAVNPALEEKLDALIARQKQTETAIATFATSRSGQMQALSATPTQPPHTLVAPNPPRNELQPALALDAPPQSQTASLTIDDFIGAMNFPKNEVDVEGFAQLRRALANLVSGKLVRASQDVLTLLSQDGIYMDDLRPERSRPELWRKFAQGQRSTAISGIGGIHDRAALAQTSSRMRADPIFRDAVHHFLRQFDRTFATFSETASDDDIIRLADTRTARAFMLLGRVAGTFD